MRVVATNGCFDCFHAGHAALLEFARQQGDHLVVLVNSDDSVRRLKGDGRPVVPLADRIAVLRSIRWVDEVIAFDDDTPDRLLSEIRPDVLVKGADNAGREVPGSQYCGKVVLAPLREGVSTTRIVQSIRDDEGRRQRKGGR